MNYVYSDGQYSNDWSRVTWSLNHNSGQNYLNVNYHIHPKISNPENKKHGRNYGNFGRIICKNLLLIFG
jgi:hypothetical protein